MFIRYKDYKGKLAKGDVVLMSADEFANGGMDLKGVPVAITPDGSEPKVAEEEYQSAPQPAPPTIEERMVKIEEENRSLREKVSQMEAKLAKTEARK